MKVNLTQKEVELILFSMVTYKTTGEYESKGIVRVPEYNTAQGIVEKLEYLFPDKE